MRASLASLYLVAALGGCETTPTHSNNPAVVDPGAAAVSVVGTPFYLAFKGVACAASAAIAAPVAGIAALSESPFAPKIGGGLGDGLSRNCGAPYVLSPYRVASVEPPPDVPKMPPPGWPPGPPNGLSDLPPPPQLLEAVPRRPDVPTPAQPPQPPADYSTAPMSEEFSEPAAGGLIELFNE